MEFRSDKTWAGRALLGLSSSELGGSKEVGGAFSLSADWEDEAVFWLETLPCCEATLDGVGLTRCEEEVRCEGDACGTVGIGKSLYVI
jgi:hypothetical protein